MSVVGHDCPDQIARLLGTHGTAAPASPRTGGMTLASCRSERLACFASVFWPLHVVSTQPAQRKVRLRFLAWM
jgi:hypothetical protein